MSVKKNTIANYIGQFYNILIGIVILPLYLKYLGAPAFGLIGLFAVMQGWLRLLDIGLTPTLSRQTAYVRGKKQDFTNLMELLRSLEIIFFTISLAIIIIVGLCSKLITYHWLKVAALPYSEVAYCITLMGIMVGLNWFTDLYKSGIRGMEYQVWLNGATFVIATLQYVGGWIFLKYISQKVDYFFDYQLLVSFINLLIIRNKCYQLFPTFLKVGFKISWKIIKTILPFASATAYTSGIWIVITQLDKLLLSNILPLSQYGYFALVSVVSGGISQISGPISQAILPRMTYLLSQNREQDMLKLYKNATQIMAVAVFAVTGVMAVFSNELLYAWTDNAIAAKWASPILFWYVLGNGILSILAFQYYLQYAYGKMRLHVLLNTIFAIIVTPMIFFVAYHYGAFGTAITWFVMEFLAFLIVPFIIHRAYAPGIHREWLLKDIAPIFLTTVVVLFFIHRIHINFEQISRLHTLMILFCFGMLVLLSNALSSEVCRGLMVKIVRKRRAL